VVWEGHYENPRRHGYTEPRTAGRLVCGRDLRGAEPRGHSRRRLTSVWLFFLLSLPFALIVSVLPVSRENRGLCGPARGIDGASVGLLGAVLVAMWNYMGWDNASTIAQEVERPRKTYPRAMIAAVILVSLTYILPFLAVYFTEPRPLHSTRRAPGPRLQARWAARLAASNGCASW